MQHSHHYRLPIRSTDTFHSKPNLKTTKYLPTWFAGTKSDQVRVCEENVSI